MRYSIDQIEAFVLAARNSSFSKAAKILGKSQSTISLAIGNLEIDLGVQLFDRSSKYPDLTDEGRALLAEAESVLFHCQIFEESSLNLLKEVESAVNLAIDETLPEDLLGAALAAMAVEYPGVDVVGIAPGREGVAAQVLCGAADLGLTVVNYRYPQEIGFYRLGQMRMANVVHRDHPLARIEEVRFSQLNATRQLAYAPIEHKMPTNQHLNSSSVWHLQGYAAIVELLRRGLGWAAMPWHLAEALLKSGELVQLRLQPYPTTPWRMNVDVIWSAKHKPGAAAWWLREFLGREKGLSAYIA